MMKDWECERAQNNNSIHPICLRSVVHVSGCEGSEEDETEIRGNKEKIENRMCQSQKYCVVMKLKPILKFPVESIFQLHEYQRIFSLNMTQNELKDIQFAQCRIKEQTLHPISSVNFELLKSLDLNTERICPLINETCEFIRKYRLKRKQGVFSNDQMREALAYFGNNLRASFHISQELQRIVSNQFFLFLTSNYKELKTFQKIEDNDKRCYIRAIIETKKTLTTYSDGREDPNVQTRRTSCTQRNSEEVEETNLCNVIQEASSFTKQCVENSEDLSDGKHNTNKRTNNFYNLPRYLMILILELLSFQNLTALHIPDGLSTMISRIAANMKRSSRKNQGKETSFYNHQHYKCLFLLLDNKVLEDNELRYLNSTVFEVTDISSPYNIAHINSMKVMIFQIIKEQLVLILKLPLSSFIMANETTYTFEKQKINYLSRVISGITKLNSGERTNRF